MSLTEKGAKSRDQVFIRCYRPGKFFAGLNYLANPGRRPIRRLDFSERMVGKVGNRLRAAFKISSKRFECLQMRAVRLEIRHRNKPDILESVSILARNLFDAPSAGPNSYGYRQHPGPALRLEYALDSNPQWQSALRHRGSARISPALLTPRDVYFLFHDLESSKNFNHQIGTLATFSLCCLSRKARLESQPTIFPSTPEPADHGAGAGVVLRGPEKHPPR
jgi:hypothetical protein